MNSELKVSDASNRLDIAIIGIGCRFPGGANSPEEFWESLRNGVDAITEVPANRWDSVAFYHPDSARPGKINTRWGGFIERIDHFDARFFGISPREATRMDPQQRMLLEAAWDALEDGGQTLERLAGAAVGVFIGVSTMDYQEITHSPNDREFIDAHTNTGGAMSIVANRISYVFDFRGPSFAVDTACSSSLTALHLATRSLRDGESKLALVGGANALLKPETTMGFSRASMLSPDGRCKAFDSSANGYTRSEGAGVVVLKPLPDALADGDPIYAVIRGTAINEDGRTSGITVPGRAAQEAMLRTAYRQAGVAPSDVQYVEAHGTGTPVGDPIEAQALGAVLGQGRPHGAHCVIGSVKTNIGHLEAGAGIAGLIKVALMLKHREIPPNLNFQEPNPNIPFDELRLRVPRKLEPWPDVKGPARAGVNSFGFGGANAHAVLEEAPKIEGRRSKVEDRGSRIEDAGLRSSILDPRSSILNPQSSYLLPLSARSPEALRAVAQAYQSFLSGEGVEAPVSDVCYTASLRRSHHDYRLALVGRSHEELAGSLKAFLDGETRTGLSSGHLVAGAHPKLVFVFSGMGPQWYAMGRQLLEREPVFREAIEQCDELFRRLAGWSLLEEMTADESRSRMGEAEVAQPANFALQVALNNLWRSWGITPDAVVGHSAGEVAAIYAAGVMSLEEAVRVIFHRSRLQQRATGKGKMAAVALSSAEAERALEGYEDRVSIAAVNSPKAVTLSGDAGAIAEIAQSLEKRQVFCRILQVEIPYHSRHMEPLKDELMGSLRELDLRPAAIPFYSTVTGRRAGLAGARELDAEYWWRNVRNPVLFAEAMERIIEDGHNVFVELSPHPVLAGAVSEGLLMSGRKGTILPSLRRQEAEREQMLGSLGALHTLGRPVAWESLYPEGGRFVRLPSYPWQRERYWQESEVSEQSRLGRQVHPLLGRRLASAHPSWELDLDTQLLPYLDDHRIQGAVVYPGAAYVEMALAAAREVFGEGPCALEDVEFQRALFLPDGETTRLQMIFDPGAASFDIYSRTKDPKQPARQQWMRHAGGKLAQEGGGAQPFSLDKIRSRCARDISDLCYPALWEFGLELGPSFQGIERLWRGERESLALLRLPETIAEESRDYQFHPALIDSCFQTLFGNLLTEEAENNRKGVVYLPVKIERLQVYGRPGSQLWSYARLTELNANSLEVDIWLLDEAGNVLIEIQGFRCQALEGAQADVPEDLNDWLYEFEWQPAAPTDRVEEATSSLIETPAEAPGSWLIFADSNGVGQRLAESLAGSGHSPILIFPGKDYRHINENRFQVCPESALDIRKLLEAVGAGISGWPACRGVIHLWSLEAPPPESMTQGSLESAQNLGCVSALRLVQELARDEWTDSPRLWLVTRGAQTAGAEMEPVAIAQSPLWGLGRVIVNEHPSLRCRMVDLDTPGRVASSQEIQMLFDELWLDDHEEEVAFRNGARYVHRLNRIAAGAAEPDSLKRVRATENQPFRLEVSEPRLLDALILRETRREAPGPGEVEIKVHAAGLNFMDVMKAVGIYPADDIRETTWLGSECAGTVVAVGENVNEFRVGDEVVALAAGCFSAFVKTDANLVAPKPAHLGFEEAATIPLVFLTVYYGLHHLARLRKGERILIHAAAGGVGLAAIQFAQLVGAEIFATAGSPEKRELLRSLGPITMDHVMDSRSLDFADEIMKLTGGKGVDVVLNSLSGEALPKSISVLGAFGRFLEIGKRDIYQNSKLGLRPFRDNLSYFAIDVSRLCLRTPVAAGEFFRELMRYFEDGTLRPVPHRAFPISDAVSAFRYMAQAKHTGKIVLSLQDQDVWVAPAIHREGGEVLSFRSDGTYLVTGGLSGFGLAIAQWMVEQGARRLVLMSRSGASSHEAETALAAMEKGGAEIVVARADVSDERQLADVLDNINKFMPPLRGVIHAAMVLDDGFLSQLDEERFRKVMAPKATGAWNLHTQTLACPLDFFVLFSSVTSLIGNPGQGNYCAANAFLDALAQYRRARNLPALAINWGAIGEVGYLARHSDVAAHLDRQGLAPLSIANATAMLEHLLRRNPAQAGAINIDWQKWSRFMPEAAASPRFSHLIRANRNQQAMDDQGEGGSSLLNLIFAAKPEERQQALATRLCEQVARVLGAAVSELDTEQPLTSFGLDSIMAVEMSHWIGNELKLDLPTMALIQTPNLSQLAAQILNQLDAKLSATSGANLETAKDTAAVENRAAGAAVG